MDVVAWGYLVWVIGDGMDMGLVRGWGSKLRMRVIRVMGIGTDMRALISL